MHSTRWPSDNSLRQGPAPVDNMSDSEDDKPLIKGRSQQISRFVTRMWLHVPGLDRHLTRRAFPPPIPFKSTET